MIATSLVGLRRIHNITARECEEVEVKKERKAVVPGEPVLLLVL